MAEKKQSAADKKAAGDKKSALETALASRRCGRSREDMMLEMKHCLGFSLEDLPECAVMRWYVEAGTL